MFIKNLPKCKCITSKHNQLEKSKAKSYWKAFLDAIGTSFTKIAGIPWI